MPLRKGPHSASPQVARITSAPVAQSVDSAHRRKHYIVLMGVRTLCFVGLVTVPSVVLKAVFLVGAVLLPYIAVLLANAGRERPRPSSSPLTPQAPRELA